jgi:hypothetical protein
VPQALLVPQVPQAYKVQLALLVLQVLQVFRVQLVCKVQLALPALAPQVQLVSRVPQDLVQLVPPGHKASQEPLAQLQQQVQQVPQG